MLENTPQNSFQFGVGSAAVPESLRQCKRCGKTFDPRVAKKGPVTTQGETRLKKYSYVRRAYCSRECFETLPIFKCEHCGNEFKKNRGASRFCSKECSREVVHKPCAICKEVFESPRSKNRVCCSQKCSGKLLKITTRKSVVTTTIQRKRLLEAKPAICRKCGYDRIPEVLEMHHIDEDKKNDSLENLEFLCPTCHDEEHFLRKSGRFTSHKISNRAKNQHHDPVPIDQNPI